MFGLFFKLIRYVCIKITNNGTIPAILTEDNYDYNFCLDSDESGIIEDDECIYEGETLASTFIKSMLPDNLFVAYAKPDGTILNIADDTSYTEEDVLEVIDPATGAMKPGASVYLISTAFFSRDYGSDDGGSVFVKAGKTYTLTFTQPTTN